MELWPPFRSRKFSSNKSNQNQTEFVPKSCPATSNHSGADCVGSIAQPHFAVSKRGLLLLGIPMFSVCGWMNIKTIACKSFDIVDVIDANKKTAINSLNVV